MIIQESSNKLAYEYNVAVIDHLKALLRPLEKANLSMCYHKVFADGSYLCLADDLSLQKKYFLDINQPIAQILSKMKNLPPHEVYEFFWPVKPQGEVLSFLHAQGARNGLSLARKGSGYIEQFHFVGSADAPQVRELYHCRTFKNDFLEKFIQDFLKEGKEVVDCSDPRRLARYDNDLRLDFCDKSDNEPFLSLLNSFQPLCLPLSPQERECIDWLSQGKKAKEIAYLMGLETCTIEFYLRRAREKTGAKNSMELLYFYTQEIKT